MAPHQIPRTTTSKAHGLPNQMVAMDTRSETPRTTYPEEGPPNLMEEHMDCVALAIHVYWCIPSIWWIWTS